MKKNAILIILPMVMSLASCGGQNTPDSSEAKVDSSIDNTSVITSSSSEVVSSESSITSSSIVTSVESSSTSEDATPSENEKNYGTVDLFMANYKALVNKDAGSITYFTKSSADYQSPSKITIAIDEDEYLKTTIAQDSEGNDLSPMYRYLALKGNEYYDVDYDGSIYSKAKRYKVGEGSASDYISEAEAQSTFSETKNSAGNAIGKIYTIKYDVKLNELISDLIVKDYGFYPEDDGSAYIEFKAIQVGSYFGNYFTIELDLTPKGDIKEGYFKRDMYMGANWDSSKGEKVDGANPNAWFSCSVSNVIYSNLENTNLFDSTAYFAESVTGIKYHYYQSDMESGTSTERNQALVGDYLTIKQFDFDNIKKTPSTACDLNSLFITKSSNEAVINDAEGYWKAVGVGTAEITIGNSFKSDVAKVTIEVVEELTPATPEEPAE